MNGLVQQTTVGPRTDVPALLWHFFKVYRRRTLIVVALLTVAGLAEGFSVLALLPFVQLALSGNGAHAGHVWQWISACLALFGLAPSVGSLLTLIVIGALLKAAVTLLAMKEVGYAVGQMMTDLRRRLVVALMEARWSYFLTRPLGLFANAICAEAIRAGVSYQQSARLAAAFIQAVIYAAATAVVSWQIALFALIAGTGGAIIFRRVVSIGHNAGERQTDLMKSLAVRMTDTLQGIKAIKAMGAEKSAIPFLDKEINELDDAQKSQVWSGELLRVAQEPLLVAILALGIYGAIEIEGQSIPTLMITALLFYRLFNRFQVMQEIYQQIGIGASAYWSVRSLGTEAEREAERSSKRGLISHAVPCIEFDAVSFRYAVHPVLQEVSLRVKPGEFIVITGQSGVGKTTMLDLISGLLTPASGVVLVDGVDLKEMDLRPWRTRLGYVPQEPLLLHDTIYRNISLGDQAISREHAREALSAAGLWRLIADLPEGMDTIVGERGGRFSGGQRQRISLARALARCPAVLLLDEITAGLDRDTEHEVCLTLRALAGKMTLFAVSHQPAIVGIADRAFRLHEGRVQKLPSASGPLPAVRA